MASTRGNAAIHLNFWLLSCLGCQWSIDPSVFIRGDGMRTFSEHGVVCWKIAARGSFALHLRNDRETLQCSSIDLEHVLVSPLKTDHSGAMPPILLPTIKHNVAFTHHIISYHIIITLPKTNMEPENGPLEDDFPLQPSGFQVPSGSLPKCIIIAFLGVCERPSLRCLHLGLRLTGCGMCLAHRTDCVLCTEEERLRALKRKGPYGVSAEKKSLMNPR